MRSSVREFLASEAMHHLGVATTRALSLIGTGDEVQRPWYAATIASSAENASPSKYPPNMWKKEPGAIVCRVARSFLRLGHLELFAIRREYKELMILADYACFREFPHLLNLEPPNRYIELYREVVRANVRLVVEWLRVGYVQGNMNSDNTCLAGRTIDYGPFGWLEEFNPKYQPFTTDRQGNFCFIMQPSAMQVNLNVLAEKTFAPLIQQSMLLDKSKQYSEEEINAAINEIKTISNDEFGSFFWSAYENMKRSKLGLKSAYSENIKEDSNWWVSLEKLLFSSKADYTIFFRELSTAADSSSAIVAFKCVEKSFNVEADAELQKKWIGWLEVYLSKLSSESSVWSASERKSSQNKANPKYILRNWMAVMAYEAAESGSYELVNEIYTLLSDPYDLNGKESDTSEKSLRWYTKTPSWATNMPGCTFMSCSS
jgi:serine/tyrosine/threonine adenylyltransferase